MAKVRPAHGELRSVCFFLFPSNELFGSNGNHLKNGLLNILAEIGYADIADLHPSPR